MRSIHAQTMLISLMVAAASAYGQTSQQGPGHAPLQRALENLGYSPAQAAGMAKQMALRANSCSSNSHKCERVCEAAEELQTSAEALTRCAASHDFSDDCDSDFSSVRDAHGEYEDAVSDASGDCD